jgi:hypothetical protein
MASGAGITMSMREIDRLKTIQAVVDGNLKLGQAARRLDLTPRQVRRLVRRYRAEGPTGLVSRHRDRPSNHQLPAGVGQVALKLIDERYRDFGPTLACEKLAECHGLPLAKETVRRLMIGAGLWVPRRMRPPKVYQPRNRRCCVGELIQIDGSNHPWFEDRAPACTLLVYVDDATSRLMQLHFTATESTFSYFEATRAYLVRHGKPVAFYSDKASVFRSTCKEAGGGDGHTQFARALFELNIESICANSSQAKGRVERAHETLQDRLVKELRLRNICSQEAANAFVGHFIADYNQRFAKPPKRDFDAHRPLRADENLDLIFTWREPRQVSKSLTLQCHKTQYLLADEPRTRRLIGRTIEVYEYPDSRVELRADGVALPYTTYDKISTIDQGAIVENKRLGHVLQLAQQVQALRDDRRNGAPSRTNRGEAPRPHSKATGTKSQRALNQADLLQALQPLAPQVDANRRAR